MTRRTLMARAGGLACSVVLLTGPVVAQTPALLPPTALPADAIVPADAEAPVYVRPPPKRLIRVMLVDARDIGADKVQPAAIAEQPVYRHTFGSQRHSPPPVEVQKFDPLRTGADVILLQGVDGLVAARRLFPARDWRLLFSRSLIVMAGMPPLQPGAAAPPSGAAATAIAIRLQPGLRFAGIDPLMPASLGTAVRLTGGMRPVWLLSAAACAATDPGCDAVAGWLKAKSATGELAIAGGLGLASQASSTAPPQPAAAAASRPLPEGASEAALTIKGGTISLSAAPVSGCRATAGRGLAVRVEVPAASGPHLSGWALSLPQAKTPLAAPPVPRAPASTAPCAFGLDLDG